MGGTSQSTQTQQSTTNPWAPAQPLLQGILGQANNSLPNTGLTGADNSAIGGIESNAAGMPNNNAGINNYITSLLNGGGATAQSGNINNAYQNYQNQTNPLASNTNYNPLNTPGLSDSLNYLTNQIGQNVNGSFAAAGRDGSPANSQALAYGLSSGLAPILTAQYNQNVQNQQNAANNLYNAGNTTAGLQTGLTQTALGNQGTGVSTLPNVPGAQDAGQNAILQAEAQKFGIPVQNLGMLANIGIPIAGLGGQSSGTSTGTQQMSGAQQFATIMGGIGALGNLWPKVGK